MSENDKQAFEEWHTREISGAFKAEFLHILEKTWTAAIEHERERSKKLIEALDEIRSYTSDKASAYFARQALAEYQGNQTR
jgi:uncharacterized protein YbgA (DUF1722 family)